MPKQLKGYVENIEKAEDGVLQVAVATDDSVDRDSERINPDGWDFDNFLRNPVLLFAHNYHDEPIGKVIDIRKEGKKILFKPQFAIDISEKARRIWELYKGGFLNAFSVGFIPREWKDSDEDGKFVREFTRAELLEISCVPVPANPEATVLARSAGIETEYKGQKLIGSKLDKPKKKEEAGEPAPADPDNTPSEPKEEPDKDGEPKNDPEPTETEPKSLEQRVETLEKKMDETHELTKQIHTLVAGTGTDEGDGMKSPDIKVENQDDEVALLAKRVLQQVDKSIGKALRDLKKGINKKA